MAGKRVKKADVIKAVKEARGYVTKTADLLGVSSQTIQNYAAEFPDIAEAIQETRENRHDFVESKLLSRIDKEDTTAIIFYLKTQCKDRGYVERQEFTGRDGESLTIKIEYVNDNSQTS